jgi:tRNA(fMet)-specific endonuclease VapC
MIRYMLDTNACIAAINGNPPELRERLQHVDPQEVAISQIVHYELAFGVCHSSQPERNQANLLHFLQYVQVLPWGNAASLEAAQIRCELLRKGKPAGPYDTLIAAHARAERAILITHNTREFVRVEGLAVEDWEAASE